MGAERTSPAAYSKLRPLRGTPACKRQHTHRRSQEWNQRERRRGGAGEGGRKGGREGGRERERERERERAVRGRLLRTCQAEPGAELHVGSLGFELLAHPCSTQGLFRFV